MSHSTTYKDAGVDIDAADNLVDRIKEAAKKTKRVEVVSGIGGFAGLFSLTNSRVENPVLVASTDGVGTKLKLAIDLNHVSGLGQDLVAMCVNDLVCCGAEPLFFLDYFATGKLDTNQAATVIESMANALSEIKCTLLGGETAEMPGLYKSGDFDLAGFAVGIVDKTKILNGSSVVHGDHVIALPSTGIHSNGFSLVRRILEDNKIDLHAPTDFAPEGLGKHLLTPTALYVNPALNSLKSGSVHAMAHITGGGIVDNLPRVMPDFCRAEINKSKIPTQPVFRYLQKLGNVPEDEMWRVFNMGTGFMMIVDKDQVAHVVNALRAVKIDAIDVGVIVKHAEKDPVVKMID